MGITSLPEFLHLLLVAVSAASPDWDGLPSLPVMNLGS